VQGTRHSEAPPTRLETLPSASATVPVDSLTQLPEGSMCLPVNTELEDPVTLMASDFGRVYTRVIYLT
jgi:hypothetical protein